MSEIKTVKVDKKKDPVFQARQYVSTAVRDLTSAAIMAARAGMPVSVIEKLERVRDEVRSVRARMD